MDSWHRKQHGRNKLLTGSSLDNLEQNMPSKGVGLSNKHLSLVVFKLLMLPGLHLISLGVLHFALGKIILEQH